MLCLSDEMPSAVCLCCHVLVSFLPLPLLLANNELLSETQSDRSCPLRPLVMLMSSVFQPLWFRIRPALTQCIRLPLLTLSGLIRLMTPPELEEILAFFPLLFPLSLCRYLGGLHIILFQHQHHTVAVCSSHIAGQAVSKANYSFFGAW